jgi:hypothetical protein
MYGKHRYYPGAALAAPIRKEKEMIDRIRERNGNLEIMVSKQENRIAEL